MLTTLPMPTRREAAREAGAGLVSAGAEAEPRPPATGLIDRFGRQARDLRVSLTERCSLRCTYCMPAEGLPRAPELSTAEIIRLVRVAVRHLGIAEVRFTGGEPLLRGDLEEIVAGCAQFAPDVPISLTTNGIGLRHRAAKLAAAGLSRVNVSLDTLDRALFAEVTRRDRLPAVLAGVAAAVEAGLAPVKINAVLLPHTLSGAADLLEWSVAQRVSLRFIEQMPLDADKGWARDQMVTAAELLAVLRRRFELERIGRPDAAAPAEEWLVDGGPATVGVIASVTRSFCGSCDRTRLTSEGAVRSCLFSDDETDLRAALRAGASDGELARLWRDAAWAKPAGHSIAAEGFAPPEKSMGAIGG
jgi:cyclic pyranopterin phosphate synthase